MKRLTPVFLIAVSWVFPGSAVYSPHRATNVAPQEATGTFAIYLVTERVDLGLIAYGKGEWSHLRLSDTPLISADDIVSYDFSKHSMRLTAPALARIPRPPVRGTPFVVVARGQRIYLGVFYTCASSFSAAVPAIVVDRYIMESARPKDTLVIERSYGPSKFAVGTDPRGDERIKAALTALHKLSER